MLLYSQSSEVVVDASLDDEHDQAVEHQESWDEDRGGAAEYDHVDKVGEHVQDDAQQKADPSGAKHSLLVPAYERSDPQAGGSQVHQDQKFHNAQLKVGEEFLNSFVREQSSSSQIRPENEA